LNENGTKNINGETLQSFCDITVGTGNWTLEELFDHFYGEELEPDAPPYAIRERIMFLSKSYHRVAYEKALSKRLHGRKEIDLWNAILDVIKTTMKSVETFNMSVCNEAKFIQYER
jgi:hypothetical protein